MPINIATGIRMRSRGNAAAAAIVNMKIINPSGESRFQLAALVIVGQAIQSADINKPTRIKAPFRSSFSGAAKTTTTAPTRHSNAEMPTVGLLAVRVSLFSVGAEDITLGRRASLKYSEW